MREAGGCSWATEKAAAGYGGTAAVSRATGVARSTIIRGAKDLLAASSAPVQVRREGAGRPALSTADPTVLEDLRGLVEPATMGDPMRPLLWVSKSREKLGSLDDLFKSPARPAMLAISAITNLGDRMQHAS